MSDVSDERLDEDTRTARVNYRKLAQQWVDDEDARTVKLAGSIVDAVKEYYEKISSAIENEASEAKKAILSGMRAKLIDGQVIWEQRHEKLKGLGEDGVDL
jgi:hypothetical protein